MHCKRAIFKEFQAALKRHQTSPKAPTEPNDEETMVEGPSDKFTYKQSEFWKYVDDMLQELCEQAMAACPSQEKLGPWLQTWVSYDDTPICYSSCAGFFRKYSRTIMLSI